MQTCSRYSHFIGIVSLERWARELFLVRPLRRSATIMRQDNAMSVSVVFHHVHRAPYPFFIFLFGAFFTNFQHLTISFFRMFTSLLFFVVFSHFHVSTSETMNRQTMQTPAGSIFIIIVSVRKCGERENYSSIRSLYETELNHTQALEEQQQKSIYSEAELRICLAEIVRRATLSHRMEQMRAQPWAKKKRQDLKSIFFLRIRWAIWSAFGWTA